MPYQQMPITAYNPPDPLETMQKGVQLRNMRQQGQLQQQTMQENAMKLQQMQQAQQDEQTFRSVLAQLPPGATIGDALPTLRGKVSAKTYIGLQEADRKIQDDMRKRTTEDLAALDAQHKAILPIYSAAMNMPDDQYAANFPQIASQYNGIPGIQQKLDPSQPITKQQLSQFGPMLAIQDAYTRGEMAKRENAAKLTTDEGKAQNMQQFGYEEKPKSLGGVDEQAMTDWMKKNPGKGPSDYVVWKAKNSPSAMNNINLLNSDSLNLAAEFYLKTGQLPSGLVRTPETTAAIMGRAAQLAKSDPGLGDVAANKANYKADSASLTALQKNFDAVSAFEKTAGKNIDLFLSQANKVIDSGSPWANTPLRQVAAGALGNSDIPAYNAARQIAVNEVAKVTSNPGLSGVLSDTARKEVENFNPQNATLKQTRDVVNVLKQDMANRHVSYQQQIAEIKGRLSGPKMQGGDTSGSPKVGDKKTFKNGNTGTWDGHGWVAD